MLDARDNVAVSVTFEWTDVGPISLDSGGKLAFPGPIPARPGLYRFSFILVGQSGLRVYIGEADQLQRRLDHYRNPGPSQRTNLRLNEVMVSHLRARGEIRLALARQALVRVHQQGAEEVLDLAVKAARLLAENAAIVHTQYAGDEELLNL